MSGTRLASPLFYRALTNPVRCDQNKRLVSEAFLRYEASDECTKRRSSRHEPAGWKTAATARPSSLKPATARGTHDLLHVPLRRKRRRNRAAKLCRRTPSKEIEQLSAQRQMPVSATRELEMVSLRQTPSGEKPNRERTACTALRHKGW